MTTYEKRNLFNRYKHDPLFRQWLPTLGILSRAGHGNEVEIWYETKRALRRIKQKTDWRDAEVHFFYTELCERYPSMPVFCLAVMTVLFTCLADAAPSTDRTEENPYASVCKAICTMLDMDQRFHTLLNVFFNYTHNIRIEQMTLTPFNVDDKNKAEKAIPLANDAGMLEQLVENALERDDTNKLNALKLRLYELERPAVTHPLINRINERITTLTNHLPITQNFFQEGASQINQSNLQNSIFCASIADKTLTKNNHEQ